MATQSSSRADSRLTQALTAMQYRAAEILDPQARFARELEHAGQLDRALESLPDDEVLAERETAHEDLCRPELSVVMAYAKNTLYESLLGSEVPDDPYFGSELERYFPTALSKRYPREIAHHRLRREIISTVIANGIVKRTGASFASEIGQDGGFSAPEIARAYTIVREVFKLRTLWEEIEALDNRVPAEVQTRMLIETEALVRTMTLWFLHSEPQPMDIAATIGHYADGITALELELALPNVMRSLDMDAYAAREARFIEDGAPPDVARRVAALAP
jgi:glutamate dehydrogenase